MNDIIGATLNCSLKWDISKTRKRWNLLHTLKPTYVQTLQLGGILHCHWANSAHCFEGSLCLPSSGSSSPKVLIQIIHLSLSTRIFPLTPHPFSSQSVFTLFITGQISLLNSLNDSHPDHYNQDILSTYQYRHLLVHHPSFILPPFVTCMVIAHMTGPSWVQAQGSYATVLSPGRRTYCHLQHKLLMRPCHSLGQGPNIHTVPVIVVRLPNHNPSHKLSKLERLNWQSKLQVSAFSVLFGWLPEELQVLDCNTLKMMAPHFCEVSGATHPVTKLLQLIHCFSDKAVFWIPALRFGSNRANNWVTGDHRPVICTTGGGRDLI